MSVAGNIKNWVQKKTFILIRFKAWHWYEPWVDVVQKDCRENKEKYSWRDYNEGIVHESA